MSKKRQHSSHCFSFFSFEGINREISFCVPSSNNCQETRTTSSDSSEDKTRTLQHDSTRRTRISHYLSFILVRRMTNGFSE